MHLNCRGAFRALSNIYDGATSENCKRLKTVQYFCKSFHHRRLVRSWIFEYVKQKVYENQTCKKLDWAKARRSSKSRYFSQDLKKDNATRYAYMHTYAYMIKYDIYICTDIYLYYTYIYPYIFTLFPYLYIYIYIYIYICMYTCIYIKICVYKLYVYMIIFVTIYFLLCSSWPSF